MKALNPSTKKVSENLHECSEVIRCGNLTVVPPAECCNALRRIQDLEATLGVQQTCNYVKSCIVLHNLPGGSCTRIPDADEPGISTQIQCAIEVLILALKFLQMLRVERIGHIHCAFSLHNLGNKNVLFNF